MKLLASPFLRIVWNNSILRHGATTCVVLALISAVAEVAVAVSLLPILASLGVDAGDGLSSVITVMTPAIWLGIFFVLAAVRSLVNWLSSVQEERGTQELVISLQTRLYRALAGAHWDAVRRISPSNLTSALQTQAYDAGYGFSSLVQVISATLLVVGYLISSAVVFPLVLPVLLLILGLMWHLNARSSSQVLTRSEYYHDAQTDLHQRYEDWVAISRIALTPAIWRIVLKPMRAWPHRTPLASAIPMPRLVRATRPRWSLPF